MNTLLEQQDEVSSLRSQEELRQKYLRLLLPTHYVPSIAISRLPLSPISKKMGSQTDREFTEAIFLVGYYAQFGTQSYCLPARSCIVLSTVLSTVLEAIREKNLSGFIDTRKERACSNECHGRT